MKNKSDTISNNPWRFDSPSSTAIPGESPEALLGRAAGLHQSGQLELAEPLYRELLALQPENGDALHLYGVLRYQQRDPAAAVPLIEAALKIIPGNVFAWVGLGLALLRLNRFEEALTSFDHALEIKPDFADALSRRGEALQALGRHKDAVAAFNRSLRYRPDHAETLNNRAAALIELGRPGEALSSLDQALALSPAYIEALNNRATALNVLKRYAEALSACDAALAIRPNVGQLHNTRGAVLRNLGRREEAVAAFRVALTEQPEAADIHANLGVTLQEMGQAERAEPHLVKALAARPGAVVYQSLAIALYQQNRNAEAVAIYQQWLAIEPDNPIPIHMLAAADNEAVPKRAADRYVAKLFDNFADSFETTLLGLGYQIPQVLTTLIKAELGDDATPLRILDAGCGTGLAAPLLKPLASQLVGVDLSPKMIDKARERALYDELVVGELCAFMASRPAAFDLIILADTLVYFGDLEEAFTTAHSALAPGGIFAIALEARSADPAGPDYKLEPHGRYSHRPDYVTQLLDAGGYELAQMEPVVLRREHNADVAGIVVVARQTGAGMGVWPHRSGTAKGTSRAATPGSSAATETLQQSMALQRQGQGAQAIKLLDQLLAVEPANTVAWLNRGDVLLALGRHAEALDSYERALTFDPQQADALYGRGLALHHLGRILEALADYERALAARPDHPQVLNYRGIALCKLDRQSEALPSFLQAIAVQPGVAEFHANLGKALLQLRQHAAAEASLRQALSLEKTAAAFENLALVFYQLGRRDEVTDIYRQWLAIEPDNPIPIHMLAAANNEAVPKRAADRYVAKLFDNFADSFETTLLGLGYQTPQVLTTLIEAELGDDTTPLRILDAGCGTGLAAPLLKPLASQLVGVDLSPKMIDKARERELYDELVVGELCAFMASRPAAFDLIILADTLVYFGDLEEAFTTAHSALAPGGIFAIALEARAADPAGPDYKLEPHGRYSHRPDYVTQLLDAGGFTPRKIENVILRRELNTDVAGIACIAHRNPEHR